MIIFDKFSDKVFENWPFSDSEKDLWKLDGSANKRLITLTNTETAKTQQTNIPFRLSGR